MGKILVADGLSGSVKDIFAKAQIECDFMPELAQDREKLLGLIDKYHGLAVRSSVTVDRELIAEAGNMQVVGRAGIGVDNIDLDAACERGIVVMNTPYGNSITTAEHAIALLVSSARQIPAADVSTRAGKWEKSRFKGVELFKKTLGLIGCGNIGSIVARLALGLGMDVIVYDPFLRPKIAHELGVERLDSLEELLAQSDFVSLHLPLNDKSANILSSERIAQMKQGAFLINSARGGLVDEEAVAEALKSGSLAGAAFDVFAVEPARENPLFSAPNMICTPHLGASTAEAQEKVATHLAEQMVDFFRDGAITNAVNAPAISAAEAESLRPWLTLGEFLGSLIGQMTESAIKQIQISYYGKVGELNIGAISAATIAALLRPMVCDDINMVSAHKMAHKRGIEISETHADAIGVFDAYIEIKIKSEKRERSAAGTVFLDQKPRLIRMMDINMESEVYPYMLYSMNRDVPGLVGDLGSLLGRRGRNIASMSLGRSEEGGRAISLVGLDKAVSEDMVKEILDLPQMLDAKKLDFSSVI